MNNLGNLLNIYLEKVQLIIKRLAYKTTQKTLVSTLLAMQLSHSNCNVNKVDLDM